ncbi:Collagen alpha-1(XII) chain Fibrochimerin Precursor [Larimichthys crocea]|uniref:Collagen alpha-1(XII) chain Fibrochimerin n=1 Tax=Larimichthys crocea TaxID=215358 RepID=A0A6G0HXH9_LARCR|nr:Collagen alpha-1(XII) chain Fibrochimerin Precursor [Larimichthys crocea]
MYPTILFSSDPRCETTDIVMLLDESGSISPADFNTMKSFVAKIVSGFDIGPDKVQIGLTLFSNTVETKWHLNTHRTKESLLKAIYDLQQRGGGTETGSALKHVLHNNFRPDVGMRADSRKVLLLITDGESQDETRTPSQHLKDTGIQVYTIGVRDADKNELLSIVSNRDALYIVDDFSSLMSITDAVITNLCNNIQSLDSVRLVNGTSPCSGRLEVKSDQSDQRWSSVCEADFDQQDAEVVCRELGCGAPSVLQGALYGEVEAPMWTKEFQCGGHESALLDCRSSGSTRNTCSPGKAVGLTCSEPVRLVGGHSRCAGTLELKHLAEWRPVDGSDWTLKAAGRACGELDCGSAVSMGMREESSSVFAWRVSSQCIQSGYSLRECLSSDSSSSIMEITCSEPVRLVGGDSRCAGTLEVKRGDWRPVHSSSLTLKSASAAVCRNLDCGSAVSTQTRRKSSLTPAWEIISQCIQSGSALRDCVSLGSFPSILEITCSDSVRLVNGTSLCSGRLEVKSNQSWSSVCEADFDQQDAEVVCRELGCGAPSVLQGALYGEVEAPMWTKEFQCGGHESALLDCRSSGSTRNTCSPGKAVGLTCSEPTVRLVGGHSRCAGTLELKLLGEWRPVDGSDWTLKAAGRACGELDCGSAASARIRKESSSVSVWRVTTDCVGSGSALRDCLSSGFSSSILEITCSDPSVHIIRLVLMLLALLSFITAISFVHKTTRGQRPGPEENIELEDFNLHVHGAEEEGAQAAE